ncbi:MAG TPA: S8 family serine peptidase, partial [Actinomycetes bacterium]|nr:S8 family serine peptidase [Actinomycetes bacterium]
KVKLVALKISQWCGFSSTAAELASFVTAADMGIDVVNISFGGYSDPADPESAVAFQAYADAIAYARSKGTLIVGSAGNAHVRIGADGRVTSHGQLTTPGTAPEDFVDLYGYYRVPTGPPGALVVSATGNLVNAPSATCPPGTEGSADDPDATCKPASDAHQPFGVGRRDQLAYYSNYGARVDVAAPGGARKFNLGAYDRGRGPDRQRPPVAAAPAGGAGGPAQGDRPLGAELHPAAVGHRHLARRPHRPALRHRLLPPGRGADLQPQRLRGRPRVRGQPLTPDRPGPALSRPGPGCGGPARPC